MGCFDGRAYPTETVDLKGLHGDQEQKSLDPSVFRTGSHSMLTTGSATSLYALCGSQPVMFYWSHNITIDGEGEFQGRDETDGCSLLAYCEDNTWRFFGAPSAVKDSTPVWTQTFGIDILTAYTTVARSGCAGELLTATVAPAAVALTTATQATVTSVSLTKGDWDVYGVVNYTPGATTSITIIGQGANTVAATLGAQDTYSQDAMAANVPGANIITTVIPKIRLSFAATTTVYLVARATFSVSTLTAGGTIRARRIR